MNFNFSKMDTPITIFTTETKTEGGIPTKPEQVEFLKCFAHVESVSLKDYETSKQNNTLNNIKIFIRDYPDITNKMEVKLLDKNEDYEVEKVIPNYRGSGFTVIDAKAVTD